MDGPGLQEAPSRCVGAGVNNVCLIPLDGVSSRVSSARAEVAMSNGGHLVTSVS